jgi:hypothetical protein
MTSLLPSHPTPDAGHFRLRKGFGDMYEEFATHKLEGLGELEDFGAYESFLTETSRTRGRPRRRRRVRSFE